LLFYNPGRKGKFVKGIVDRICSEWREFATNPGYMANAKDLAEKIVRMK